MRMRFPRRLLRATVFVMAWLSAAAFGQAVRIAHDVGGVVSRGSGALVAHDDGASYYITCGHLFDDGRGRTSIQIPNAAGVPAEIIAADRAHDLALLRSPRVGGPVLPYDPEGEMRGELSAYGFGGSGRFRGVRGPVVGYATPGGARYPSLRLRGSVRSGDSGGPVLDEDRELVAVIWGEASGETYATFGPPLRAMMANLAQCRGGVCRPTQPQRRPRGGSRGVVLHPSTGSIAPVNRTPNPDPWLPFREETEGRLDRIERALTELSEAHLSDRSADLDVLKRIEQAVGGIDRECSGCECDTAGLEQKVASLEASIAALGGRLDRPQTETTRRHYTLVADQGAEYWPRLSDEYRRARESYQGVRLSPPPRAEPARCRLLWSGRTRRQWEASGATAP